MKINFRSKKFLFVLFLVLFISWLFFTKSGQTSYKSFLVITQEIPSSPVRPLTLVTQKPTVESFEVPDGSRKLKVDLVRPAGKKKFPVVIVSPGAGIPFGQSATGDLSMALGRIGVGVAFVEIPELKNLGKDYSQLGLGPITPSLINAFKYFHAQSYATKVGYMGFCVGATMSLIAAEDPSINNEVSFIIAFQPSYGWGTSYILSGYALRPDGTFRAYLPNDLTLEVVKNIYIEKLDPSDRELLIKNQLAHQNIPVEGLSQAGQKVYDFLNNKDPKKFNDFYDLLSEVVKKNTRTLNVNLGIKQLKAKVFIFSSAVDSFMSIEESDLLAKDLPVSQVYYARLTSLVHIQPDEHFKLFSDLGEYAKIYGFIYSSLKFLN